MYTKRLGNLRALLAGDPAEARKELLKHVSEIRMIPQGGNGKPHYIAEGAWNLLGNEKRCCLFYRRILYANSDGCGDWI